MEVVTLMESFRSFVESETGYYTYSDRFPNMSGQDKDIMIYLDDNSPWTFSSDGKVITINIVLTFRFRLDMLESGYYELNAQQEVLNFLVSIEHQFTPPGFTFSHRQTRCFRGDQGEYVIENNIEFDTIEDC